MKQSSIIRTLVTILALLALVSGMAMAQTSKGSITGVVTDVSEAVIPNATVTATATQGGETRSAVSGPNGQYIINALTPGLYAIKVEAKGFSTLKVENVDVKAAMTSTVNGKLTVSSTSETVTVEATSGQELQTISGEISHSISPKEVKEIPIAGLNPIALALTEPGVVAPSGREDFSNGVSFSANGTRPRANNFLIDGFDNNDSSIAGQAFQSINTEAIGEVVVLTNSYGAEYGRGGGSVTNVTYKGGNNKFHGSVWDLYQNSKLNSTNSQDKLYGVDKAPMNEHTYGFSFGGPAIKDKLFFFGTSQWDRYRTSANGWGMLVPTPAGYSALESMAGNPNVDRLLTALGSLRGIENTDPQNTIALGNDALGNPRPDVQFGYAARSGVTERSDGIQWNVRVDWVPTERDTFTFRYLMDDSVLTPDFFTNAGALPGFDTSQGGRSQNFGILNTHTFSPSVVNEFRFSYGRINFGFLPTTETLGNPIATGPYVTIGDLFGFGLDSGYPQSRTDNTFQYQDAINWVKGNHTLKFGADIARALNIEGIPFNSRGTLNYVDGGGYTALGNYVDGYTGPGIGSIGKVWGTSRVYPYALTQAYYFQDAWRIKSNLTLNYGVRYENYGMPANVLAYPGLDTSLGAQAGVDFLNRVEIKHDNNNFAPRLSFAYTPKFWRGLFGEDKTVIRAGYGMFYDSLFNNITNNTAASSPNAFGANLHGVVAGGRGYDDPYGRLAAMVAAPSPTASVTGIDSKLVNPTTHQWNFDIQRELPGNFILTTAYVGTRGIRLFANNQVNPYSPLTDKRLNPDRGSIAVRGNYGDSIYHGMNVKLDRRFSKGLLLRAAYTWSKLIDTASEVFVTSGYSSYPQDLNNRRGDRGLSAYDRRHRFVLTYVYEIPNLKLSNNFANSLAFAIRDWSISGTTSFQAGAPETVVVGSMLDVNGDGIYNDRPNLGNPSAPINSWAYDASWAGGPAGTYLNGADDSPVTLDQVRWYIGEYGTNGNVGRNTIIGHGNQNWNFALARNFRIPGKLEGQTLQFKTEIFNPFNHKNLGTPTYVLGDPDFANSEITRDGDRSIRFWLKYSF